MVNASLLEAPAGKAVSFAVSKWERDSLDIRPALGPGVLRVEALRIFPRIEGVSVETLYFDLVSRTLIDQLSVWLERDDFASRRFTLTKIGEGPASRWQLAVGPPRG